MIRPRTSVVGKALCVCSCGTIRLVFRGSLKTGRSHTCGCARVKHAESIGAATPEYRLWRRMIRRCENPNHSTYPYYGGRGIRVCRKWRESFSAFLADVGRQPEGRTLDRIDNNGHYRPGNVRWATRSEQMDNRRRLIRGRVRRQA